MRVSKEEYSRIIEKLEYIIEDHYEGGDKYTVNKILQDVIDKLVKIKEVDIW